MTITKKKLYSLIFVLVLIFLLPVTIYFLKERADIRPRAQLAGSANFRLNADTTNIAVGQTMSVLVSVELTQASVRASAVDFMLLYDPNKFNPISFTPITGNNFTDIVILDDAGQQYSAEGNIYNFLRLSMISQKPKEQLPGGTIQLANVTFEARQAGTSIIKFPDDNSNLQVVGTSL